MVKEKRWKDAKEFYSKGITALKQMPSDPENEEQQVEKHVKDGEGCKEGQEPEEEEIAKEKKMEEACYVNRALCNLELPNEMMNLENYRSTLHDTSHVLTLAPSNIKAHYRAALALLHLSRHTEALDLVTRALNLTSPPPKPPSSTSPSTSSPSPEHASFLSLHTRITAAQTAHTAALSTRHARDQRISHEKTTLSAAFLARNIRTRSTGKEPDLEDAIPCLKPDPLDPSSSLYLPVLILYPISGQTDFLKSVAESSTLNDIISTVLSDPPPWDDSGEYTAGNVHCFMQTVSGGLAKVGQKMTLLSVLGTEKSGPAGKVEVVDGIVRVFVVPKGRVGEWVAEMKKRQGNGRKD
ncbi:MAG: hypothetical protein Q9183_006106 [Haloplaca sp. 2 TL-2023]